MFIRVSLILERFVVVDVYSVVSFIWYNFYLIVNILVVLNYVIVVFFFFGFLVWCEYGMIKVVFYCILRFYCFVVLVVEVIKLIILKIDDVRNVKGKIVNGILLLVGNEKLIVFGIELWFYKYWL